MNAFRVLPVAVVIFLSLGVASVFAPGYAVGTPILGTTGNPALAAPSLFSGGVTVLYADGQPVVLEANHVDLLLCSGASNSTSTNGSMNLYANATCVNVPSTLKQTAPGAYTYTFTPPSSLTGTITIFVMAGSLADDNGKVFPSVDTSIGTYVSSASTSSSSSSASSGSAAAGTPVTSTPASQVRPAVNEAQAYPTQASPLLEVIVALTILSLAGCALVLLPSRR